METREAYKQRLDAELNEWMTQINLMDAKAENAEAGAKIRYARDLDVLHAKLREVNRKIKDLENASGDVWEGVKMTADEAWVSLRGCAAKMTSKIK